MKTKLLIIIAITILVAMYFLMHARIWPEHEPCDVGFQHYHFGYCGSNSFVILAFATHDPNQLYEHSIILPPDMKEKPFDEFMDWCMPFYGDKCVKLEKNRIPKVLSPLKQFKSGIVIDEIQCKENLVLIQKHDGSPACVTQSTAPRLADRGWTWILNFWKDSPLLIPPTEYVIKTNDGTYVSQYMMPSASANSISYDEVSNSLILLMHSNERGILHIIMPNGLLHSIHDAPFSYAVTVNGKEVEHEESSSMILKISFESGTERIEIMGTDTLK